MEMSVPCDSETLSKANFCKLKMENMKQALLKTASFIQKESSTHIKVETVCHSNCFINPKPFHADDISLHSEFHSQFSSSSIKSAEPDLETLLCIKPQEVMGKNYKLLSNSASSLHSEFIRGNEVSHQKKNRMYVSHPSLAHEKSVSFNEDAEPSATLLPDTGICLNQTSDCDTAALTDKQVLICKKDALRSEQKEESSDKNRVEENCDQRSEGSSSECEIDPKVMEEIEDFEKLVAQHMKHHKMS